MWQAACEPKCQIRKTEGIRKQYLGQETRNPQNLPNGPKIFRETQNKVSHNCTGQRDKRQEETWIKITLGEVISTILKTRKGGRDRQEVKELNINQTVTVNRTRCKYKTREYLYKETHQEMSLLEKYQEPKP